MTTTKPLPWLISKSSTSADDARTSYLLMTRII